MLHPDGSGQREPTAGVFLGHVLADVLISQAEVLTDEFLHDLVHDLVGTGTLEGADRPAERGALLGAYLLLTPLPRLVRAATTTRSSLHPLVMNALDPLSTQPSPSRIAVVLSAARAQGPGRAARRQPPGTPGQASPSEARRPRSPAGCHGMSTDV
jgi:hypothetical protein